MFLVFLLGIWASLPGHLRFSSLMRPVILRKELIFEPSTGPGRRFSSYAMIYHDHGVRRLEFAWRFVVICTVAQPSTGCTQELKSRSVDIETLGSCMFIWIGACTLSPALLNSFSVGSPHFSDRGDSTLDRVCRLPSCKYLSRYLIINGNS